MHFFSYAMVFFHVWFANLTIFISKSVHYSKSVFVGGIEPRLLTNSLSLTFNKLVSGDFLQLFFGESVFPKSLPVLHAPHNLDQTHISSPTNEHIIGSFTNPT